MIEGLPSNLLPLSAEFLFYLITLIFTLYSLAIAYHWFSYGTEKKTASTALSVYLMVSASLFLFLIYSLVTL